MRSFAQFTLLVCLVALSSTISSAQLRPWKIVLHSGDTLTACRLEKVDKRVLTASCDLHSVTIPLDSIDEISCHRESKFWTDAAIGSAIGLFVGAIVGGATYDQSKNSSWFALDLNAAAIGAGALIGTAVGFGIGGLIGACAEGEEIHDLRGQSPRIRQYLIGRLIED